MKHHEIKQISRRKTRFYTVALTNRRCPHLVLLITSALITCAGVIPSDSFCFCCWKRGLRMTLVTMTKMMVLITSTTQAGATREP